MKALLKSYKRLLAISLAVVVMMQSPLSVSAANSVAQNEVLTEDVVVEEVAVEENLSESAETEAGEVLTKEGLTEETSSTESQAEEILTEETSSTESQAEEILTEEVLGTESQTEEILTEETSFVEEILTEEITTEEVLTQETMTEEETQTQEMDMEVTSTSTAADFTISNGVLTKYTGTATDVIVPNGVTAIGEKAFYENINIVNVTLPSTVKIIGYGAFRRCESLYSVKFGGKETEIGEEAFYDCFSLRSINIPSSVKKIHKSAFGYCSGLKFLTLNEGLETIDDYAFNNSAISGKLVIPSTVKYIGLRVFNGCSNLSEVEFANGTNTELKFHPLYSTNVFTFSGVKKLTLPKRLTYIPAEICTSAKSLQEVVIQGDITYIGYQAFDACYALEKINMPQSLKEINIRAFGSCGNLKNIDLNEGLEYIGMNAFAGSGLNGTITIPSTVTYVGSDPFAYTNIKVAKFENGHNEVLKLDAQTFSSSYELEEIYLPERLRIIPSFFTQMNSDLRVLYIPQSVTSIASYAVNTNWAKSVVIYGTPGSVAEEYCQENNIPFKNKTELGLGVTGITLSPTQINRAGASAIGENIKLTATVTPDKAINKAVTFTTSNASVVTVANGIATIKGYGTATITATTVDGGYTATCKVNVIRQMTASEKSSMKKQIAALNDFRLLKGLYKNLNEVAINTPAGVTAKWKETYDIETGTNSTYDMIISKEGYADTVIEDFTVTGIDIKGVTVTGLSLIKAGKQTTLKCDITAEGGTLKSTDYSVVWSGFGKNISYNVNTGASIKITGNKATKAKITATVTIKDKNNKTAKYSNSLAIKVVDYDIADAITVTAKNKDTAKNVELSALKKLEKDTNATFVLTAKVLSEGKTINNPKLTWKSGNAKIAKVVANTDGTATLSTTGKVAGSTMITVTASGNGGYQTSFKVTVVDSTPRLEEKTATINLYKTDASAIVNIVPAEGYAVDASSLQIFDSKENVSGNYTISKVDGTQYKIAVKNVDSIKVGSLKLYIAAKTTSKEAESHKLPITLKIVKQAPKLTVTQTAINLYEKAGKGTLTLASDAEISSIEFTPANTNKAAYLVKDSVNVNTGTLTYKAYGATASNYKNVFNKGTLKVTFAGYTDEATYNKAITLKVNKTAPAFVMIASPATVYPGTAANTAKLNICEKATKAAVYATNGYSLSVTAPTKYTVTQATATAPAKVSLATGAKAGKVTCTITNSSWYDTVKAKATCSIKTGKKPVLAFGDKTITLNTKHTGSSYGKLYTEMSIPGLESSINSIKVTGKNKAAQSAYNDGKLLVTYDSGKLYAQIADVSYFKKAAKYTYTITATTTDGVEASGNIVIAVATASPSVILKASGVINLLDRENTQVVYTPTVKNYISDIKSVALEGANSNIFTATYNNGKIYVKAKVGKNISANKAYLLNMKFTLESGAVVESGKIKVTPKQINPKITATPASLVLFESAVGENYGKTITLASNNESVEIENIQLQNSQGSFAFKKIADNQGKIYVTDDASVTAGKKYTIQLAVTFKGHAENVKPMIVKINVDYRK